MPTYEYLCKVCDLDFEIEQSINEIAQAMCPTCKIYTENRLISRTNFVLKGDGWAKDNYSSSNT